MYYLCKSPSAELSIAALSTASESAANDPIAGQRSELLVRLLGAEFDLERAMAETGNSGLPAEAVEQLQRLAALRREVGTAATTDLRSIQKAVAAAVSATESIAETTRAGSAPTGRSADREKARGNVIRIAGDYYERRLLDPYLAFASEQDEEEFRSRERRNREAIERELAKGTPEGDRKAAEIMRTQLLDAKDHGADASPDFARMMASNDASLATFREGVAKPDHPAPAVAASEKPASNTELDSVRAALCAAGVSTLLEQPENQEPALACAVRVPGTVKRSGPA